MFFKIFYFTIITNTLVFNNLTISMLLIESFKAGLDRFLPTIRLWMEL